MIIQALEFDLQPLLLKHRFFQWENYAKGAKRNLNSVDAAIFDIAKRHRDEERADDRYNQLWQNLLYFLLVEKHPSIARLRNKLDDPAHNYVPDSPKLGGEIDSSLQQAEMMKSDVLTLMKLRNEHAVDLGFEDFPHLCLNLHEVTLPDMEQMVRVHLQQAEKGVKSLIKTHSLSWDNWFSDLEKISDRLDPDKQWVNKILRPFGFESLIDELIIIENEEGMAGCSISWGHGLGLIHRPVISAQHLRTLAHELGHILVAAANNEGGIYAELSNLYDEALAVVFEYLFIRQYPDQLIRKQMEDLFELEYFRCACSALFEFELWKNPEQAEELYTKHFQRIGLEIKHPQLWPLDSFRSIDPLTIYTYVIGAMFAKIIEGRCRKQFGDNTEKWGQWFVENFLKDGMKRPLFNKFL